MELAFNKWEAKEGRALLKLTELKQQERRSSSVLLQPEFLCSPSLDCISSCTKFTMPQRCHHFGCSIAEVALLRDYHARRYT